MLPVSPEVAVKIKAHRISKIDLIKHDKGKGATFSSKVILKAIKNALKCK